MNNYKTRYITQIAAMSAVAGVLMMFEFPLWFAPGFYKMDLSDLPALIGGFAMGPVAGMFIELFKVIISVILGGTSTFFVGEISNFIIGCSFVVPASVVYKYAKSRKGAYAGMITGSLILTSIGSAMNAFVLIPAYVRILGLPMEQIVAMGTAVNPAITSLSSLVLFAVVPFNFLKGVLVSAITALIYKKIRILIK